MTGTIWRNTIGDGGRGEITTMTNKVVAKGRRIAPGNSLQEQYVNGKSIGDRIISTTTDVGDGVTPQSTDFTNNNVTSGDSRPIWSNTACTLNAHTMSEMRDAAPVPFGKALDKIISLLRAVDDAEKKLTTCKGEPECKAAQAAITKAQAARDAAWPKKILNARDFVGEWPVVPDFDANQRRKLTTPHFEGLPKTSVRYFESRIAAGTSPADFGIFSCSFWISSTEL